MERITERVEEHDKKGGLHRDLMTHRTSLYTVIVLCVVLLALRLGGSTRSALTWDVFGYYLYLPALFIHDDIALKEHAWLDEVMATYEPSSTLYQLVDAADGARVVKYSAGMAVAFAPFFFLAHVLAGPLGFPTDGFSEPYRWFVAYGALFYIVIGLFLFRRVLLHFFSDAWTALLITVTVLGTNYLQLAAFDGTLLTHPFLFTLYTGLVLATIKWHERPTVFLALLLGALCGYITLVRPSEGVCVIIPILWASSEGFMAKWRSVAKHFHHVLLALIAFVIALLPQLYYWHSVTGSWIFYSYVNPGEGFDFASPHTIDFLLSFRKGWFIYTPLMAVAVLGLVEVWKQARYLFWPIVVFVLADIYLISSWSNWWYAGGSFSARGIVPAYPLLAISLGFLYRELAKWNWSGRAAMICVSGFLVLNVFQTWQWTQGIISKERMTGSYYAAIFGRTAVPDGAERLLSVGRPISTEEILTDTTGYMQRSLFTASYNELPNSEFILSSDIPFAPGPDVRFAELTDKDHAWLRASARLWVGDSIVEPPLIVIEFKHDGGTYKYRAEKWNIPVGARNTWVMSKVDYITPEVRSTEDNVKVYIWNQAGHDHRIDDLRVDVFEPKEEG